MARKKNTSSKPKEKNHWDQVFCDFRSNEDAELFLLSLVWESGIKENKLRIVPLPVERGNGYSVIMTSVSRAQRDLLNIESKKFGRTAFRSM